MSPASGGAGIGSGGGALVVVVVVVGGTVEVVVGTAVTVGPVTVDVVGGGASGMVCDVDVAADGWVVAALVEVADVDDSLLLQAVTARRNAEAHHTSGRVEPSPGHVIEISAHRLSFHAGRASERSRARTGPTRGGGLDRTPTFARGTVDGRHASSAATDAAADTSKPVATEDREPLFSSAVPEQHASTRDTRDRDPSVTNGTVALLWPVRRPPSACPRPPPVGTVGTGAPGSLVGSII